MRDCFVVIMAMKKPISSVSGTESKTRAAFPQFPKATFASGIEFVVRQYIRRNAPFVSMGEGEPSFDTANH